MNQFSRLESAPRKTGYGDKLKIISIEWPSGYPLQHGTETRMVIHVRAFEDFSEVCLGISFLNLEGVRLATYDTDLKEGAGYSVKKGDDVCFEIDIPSLPAGPGIYILDMAARSGLRYLDYLPNALEVEVVSGQSTPLLIGRGGAGFRLPSTTRIQINHSPT
jgi:lipopolysaccharide transport system ATP-binding protein